MIHERTRTFSALALCAVLAGALVVIVIAVPSVESAPTPIDVALDFGQFEPGVAQVETRVVDVPVKSVVLEAGVGVATGFARQIDWSFELCQRSSCRDLVVGDTLEPGVYVLRISGVLSTEVAPGAEGAVAGRVLLVESAPGTASLDRSQFIWLAVIGFLTAVAVTSIVHHAQVRHEQILHARMLHEQGRHEHGRHEPSRHEHVRRTRDRHHAGSVWR